MLSYSTMPSVKSVLATAASLAASAVLVRTIANDLVPRQFQDYFFSTLYTLLHRLSSQFTIIVDEYNGFSRNQLYKAAEIYLGTMISPSTRRLKVTKSHKDKNCKIAMARNEEVVDTFQGIQIKWRLISRDIQMVDKVESQVSYFELSFHKKHREKVMDSYFQHVINKADKIKEELKSMKVHALQHGRRINLRRSNLAGAWNSVNLEHPATFETLAMDPELKRAVMEDLKKFVERKELYSRVGKAWKRGYLLYGPPGTGKSSLIAAMANFLKFNIYDLELTDIGCNSEFRKLLLATENRSIIVIEDVDCTIDLQNQGWQKISRGRFGTVRLSFRTNTHQGSQVTLSGLLNFIDGLWSSCGDERIIVFTTNHKDRIDPALLRPGRMDMHIHMSYLKASAFDILASNYLAIDDHELFQEIWQLLSEVEVTPAQVAEELMKSNDPDVSLGGLIRYLQGKKSECEEEREMREEMKGDGEENMKDKWTAYGGGGREERRMKT